MHRLDIKPLSVNEAWQGKRFKTKKYKAYERDILMMLGPFTVPDGNLRLSLTFGFSNSASDIDNPVKCFTDCLQKKYGFNDSRIYQLMVSKVKVKKGDEFIQWEITRYRQLLKDEGVKPCV